MVTDEPELHYRLHLLPVGRFPFRRWRYELWHGPMLLATGWRTTEAHAERALRERAAHFVHRRMGLHVLRPETATVSASLRAGARARLECGALSCWLSALPARSAA